MSKVIVPNGRDIGSLPAASLAYYLAYVLYAISCFLERTLFVSIFGIPTATFCNAIQAVALVLLIAKFLSQRASLRGWAMALMVVLVGFVSWRQASEGWLFWLALFVVCSDRISIKTLAGLTLAVVAAMTAITVSCCLLGLIENRVTIRAGETRQALGFAHPNGLGYFLLLICVSFSAFRFGRNPLPDIILIGATVAINLAVADSRSSALLSVLQAALLIAFYLIKKPGTRRLFSIVCIIGVGVIVAFSFYLMVAYDASNPIHYALNVLFSTRFSLAHSYYQMQHLTLFGSDYSQFAPIYWENGNPYAFVVDNAYCHLILRYGIVPSALFLIGLFTLLVKLVRERRWDALLFGLILMPVYGIGETLGIRVECNYFLVAMGTELLFGENGLLHRGGLANINRAVAAESISGDAR